MISNFPASKMSPLIPVSCYSHPCTVFSPTLGLVCVSNSLVMAEVVVCHFWDYVMKVRLLSWESFLFSPLGSLTLGEAGWWAALWGGPCSEEPKPLSNSHLSKLGRVTSRPCQAGDRSPTNTLRRCDKSWPRITQLSLSWIPDPQTLWDNVFFKLFVLFFVF